MYFRVVCIYTLLWMMNIRLEASKELLNGELTIANEKVESMTADLAHKEREIEALKLRYVCL